MVVEDPAVADAVDVVDGDEKLCSKGYYMI